MHRTNTNTKLNTTLGDVNIIVLGKNEIMLELGDNVVVNSVSYRGTMYFSFVNNKWTNEYGRNYIRRRGVSNDRPSDAVRTKLRNILGDILDKWAASNENLFDEAVYNSLTNNMDRDAEKIRDLKDQIEKLEDKIRQEFGTLGAAEQEKYLKEKFPGITNSLEESKLREEVKNTTFCGN